jgi:hypothetical protein
MPSIGRASRLSAGWEATLVDPLPADGQDVSRRLMSTEPDAKAQRVFLVIDNGSVHRGQRSIDRLRGSGPT